MNGLALIHLVTNNKEDIAAAHGVESWLNATDGVTFLIAGLCFAIGSTLFCYLFLRARSVPLPLAWLGVISSLLLVIALPLQILNVMKGGMAIWMPMLVFEVWFAFWLIFKGVSAPQPRTA